MNNSLCSNATFLHTSTLICFTFFFLLRTEAQPTTCPDCSQSEIAILKEVNTKYLGIIGTNPSVPSTYNLIGDHKFSGSFYDISNIAFGNNWYPIREEKQILCGIFQRFGVSNYGDESDWNIHIVPNAGFESFIADAIPFQADNWYRSGDWSTDENGHFTIEAEITPDDRRYGNPWFNNNDKKGYLLNQQVCVYGPFVREEAHGNGPEIHPCEQIWWKENENLYKILLINDDSNRFNDTGDYYKGEVSTQDFKAWTQEKGQEAELSIPFEINPNQGTLYFSVQALDDHNFYSEANYPDVSGDTKHIITCFGIPILTVEESSDIDKFIGVTFRDVCFNRSEGVIQGYIVLKTAIGNGSGKEGFVALQIDKRQVAFNEKPGIIAGDIGNTWKVYNPLYDSQVFFDDIISSDKNGKGIVDGIIDFNGNGKTDLFAKKGIKWMVLYDGKGTWQEINTSSDPKDELRFGDVNGDNITDILYVDSGHKVRVSYNGTSRWETITDAGEQTRDIRVGDFNGDNKTDIVYMKFINIIPNTYPVKLIFNMFVKFSCTGSWHVLNNGYNLNTNSAIYQASTRSNDYHNNFRFGNFNGDEITDIFRYFDNKFVVYYNGTGNYKVLNDEGVSGFKTEDLLFVNNMSKLGYTDIIHVNKITKKWTTYYGGKPGTLPLVMKYNDPVKVFFGDLDTDSVWEPFVLDNVKQPALPDGITTVAKIKVDPTVLPKYEKGSIKRITTDGKSSLVIDMNLIYYPGTDNTARRKDDYRNIAMIREKSNSKVLSFKPGELMIREMEALGKIENVPLDGAKENQIEAKFTSITDSLKFKLPAYSIGGMADKINETIGSAGDWESWKSSLSPGIKAEYSSLMTTSPALIEKVKRIKFELVPYYSSVERGKVSLIEMDDAMKELNEIAYGTDKSRVKDFFGNPNVFTIQWNFELRDMVSGSIIPIPHPNLITTDGMWSNSSIAYEFPQQKALLQFKAVATIIDPLGNTSIQPVEFIFYNQRITFTQPKKEIEIWLEKIRTSSADNYKFLITKANYLAKDNTLTPNEMVSLLK